ncbi:MAG: cupin domain-containing protein [Acidimicrobiales bacterium]|nr:MAG: cupin domain-containing protein [Acidimicrobiales bacterium]
MRIAKESVPVKFAVPGATARQLPDFGDATGFGAIGGEYFSLGAGTDIAPLLTGLVDDMCQAPHWGYVISGGLVVGYTDGSEDTCSGGDLFYWPPGHTVSVTDDAEVVLFSPQAEHTHVLDHMMVKMQG